MVRNYVATVSVAILVMFAGAERNVVRADPAVTAIAVGGSALIAYGLFRKTPPPYDPDRIIAGAGAFDAVDGENRAAAFRVEYRPEFNYRRVGTLFGIEATTDGGFYGYAGLRVDVALGRRFLISPNFSVAGYVQGDGKDLGSPAHFRSGIDLFWRFDRGGRVGLSFHHLSHASLFGDKNPGTETLLLTYSVPLGHIL